MDLAAEVSNLVEQIPPGRVSTFTDLAEGLGDPRAAMAVFRILRESPAVASHRVVRASGEPWAPGATMRLRREGVRVAGGRVDGLDHLRWREFQGPQTLARLRAEQRRLAGDLETSDRFPEIERVAGFDVSYDRDTAFASAVVMDASGDGVLQEVSLETRVDFPYIPGYLANREFPAIEACFRRLDPAPDLLMIDGHGILHPARFGIASYAGVRLDRPSIGVAKSLLVGTPGPSPRDPSGSTDVRLDGEVLGAGLRSGRSRRMVYVSTGNRVSLETAVRITKRLCKSRIPEPLRRADLASRKMKRK